MSDIQVNRAQRRVDEVVKQEDPEERVKIILERSDKIPKIGLNVGHNGTNYLIKPGVVVSVPRKILNILRDAQESVPILDPETQAPIGYEDRTKYPFTIVN